MQDSIPTDPGEAWRDVHGLGGRYSVSSHARVYSHLTGRLLRASYTGKGYPAFRLTLPSSPARSKHIKVHILMLEAFVCPRPAPDIQGRHLNDDRNDNRLENLAWGTRSQNVRDAIRNGKLIPRRGHRVTNLGEECRNGHALVGDNLIIRSDGGRRCRACQVAVRAAKRRAAGVASADERELVNRHDLVRATRHRNSLKAECPRGHAYTGDNLYVAANGNRHCRQCRRDRYSLSVSRATEAPAQTD